MDFHVNFLFSYSIFTHSIICIANVKEFYNYPFTGLELGTNIFAYLFYMKPHLHILKLNSVIKNNF